MAFVLAGTVVTFDPATPVLEEGEVYVGDDGRLAAVQPAGGTAPPGFAAAERIDTGAVVYPGLIDLHSHLAYNTLPLWEAAGVPYQHHDRWPGEKRAPEYGTSISWPARVLGQAAAEALVKYVEVKALVGGTTMIQGAPHTTRPVDGWLVRIVDVEKLPAGRDVIMCSALQKDVVTLRESVAPKLRAGQAMIYHVAEGLPGTVVHDEFTDLDSGDCLQPGLIGVHATALTGPDFDHWRAQVQAVDGERRPTIVWSPFSNLWLYHRSTDVVDAHERGVRITLGSDWAPSGTKHVLGELKVADLLNRTVFGGHFSDRELCEMVTANPGDALAVAWGPQVGRLAAGSAADLVVCQRRRDDPFRNLIEATERDIRLVVVRGTPFYGTRGADVRGRRGRHQLDHRRRRTPRDRRTPARAHRRDARLAGCQAGAAGGAPRPRRRLARGAGRARGVGRPARRPAGAAGAVRRHARRRSRAARRQRRDPRRPRDPVARRAHARRRLLRRGRALGPA